MLTPSETEAGWLKAQDQRLLAKTAPNVPVDGTLPAGSPTHGLETTIKTIYNF